MNQLQARLILIFSLFFQFLTSGVHALEPNVNEQRTITTPTQGRTIAFEVDESSVTVEFEAIGNPSALKIHGVCRKLKADLKREKGKVLGEFRFTLDCLETGISLRDQHMKEKYLETGRFPESRLKFEGVPFEESSSSGETLTDQDFHGQLSLHGVTRPVQGKVTLSKNPLETNHTDVTAVVKLKLTDFQIETPSFARIRVADEVIVKVKFRAAIREAMKTPTSDIKNVKETKGS